MRLLSFLLVAMMMVSLLGVGAFAGDTANDASIAVENIDASDSKAETNKPTVTEGMDFTSSEAAASGEGWAWDSATKTLSLKGVSVQTNIVLPDGSTIYVEDGTESDVAVESGNAIYVDGSLTINGAGKLSVASGFDVSDARAIRATASITVKDTELSAQAECAVAAPSVSITDSKVDLYGYYYGIHAKTTTGEADSVVTLNNVSGKIAGFGYGGINAHSETANVSVELDACHDLEIYNEVENDSTSVNFNFAGIRAYTRGSGKDAMVSIAYCEDVTIQNSTMAILAANNANAANPEAAESTVYIKESKGIKLVGNTSCYSAVFVNNYGVENDDSAVLSIANSEVEVLAPNATALMTSTKSAPSKVNVADSDVTITAGLTGIRTIASSAEYADTDVTGSTVTFVLPAGHNAVDESVGTVVADEAFADEASTIIVKKPAVTYEVATKDELVNAIANAADGDTVKLTADIESDAVIAITKAITLDLGGNKLTTTNGWGGLQLKNGCSVKNGTLLHTGRVNAIRAWDVVSLEDLVIEVTDTTEGKTVGGISIQENAAGIDTIKNVTLKGVGLDYGIETYNCGNAQVIGTMENVNIDAVGTGMVISAPCGTATNCTIKGGVSGIDMLLKGTYSVSIDLVNCTVEGGEQAVYAHDEQMGYTYVGSIQLTADEETDFVNANGVYLKEEIASTTSADLDDVRNYKVTFIGSIDELLAFAQAVNEGNTFKGETVKLTADLDFKGGNWLEIDENGTVVTDFRIPNFAGTFDGQNHVIKNFNYVVSKSGDYRAMMFSGTLTGIVKNLTVENVTATIAGGKTRVAAVANTINANSATNARLDNVHVKNFTVNCNNLTTDQTWFGGLSVYTNGGNLAIKDCSVTDFTLNANGVYMGSAVSSCITPNNDFVNVTVTNFTANIDTVNGVFGGFAGQTQSGGTNASFTNCHVIGLDVNIKEITGDNVGGFMSTIGAATQFYNCSTQGTIDVTEDTLTTKSVGGFIGDHGWNGMYGADRQHEFKNCVADVDITAVSANVGGFVGNSTIAGHPERHIPAYFVDCEAKGDVKTTNGAAGGFVGQGDRGLFTDCSASGNVTGNIAGGFWGYIYPKTKAEAMGSTHKDPLSKSILLDGCVATGTVEGTAYEAGLIGFMKDVYVDANNELGYATPVILSGNTPSDYNRFDYSGYGETPDITVYVATVNGQGYETLKDAIDAANATEGGATVTLLADVTLGEKLTITGNVTITGKYTITWADGYNGTLFNVENGATLTLKDVTIDGENAFTFYNDTTTVEDGQNWYTRFVDVGEEDKAINDNVIVNAGNLTLDSVRITGVTIASDGPSGKTENTESGYVLMYNDDLALIKSNGGKVTINGGVIMYNAGMVLNAINAETSLNTNVMYNMGAGNKGGIIIANGGTMDIKGVITYNKAMARSATILGVINGAEVTFNAVMNYNEHIGVGSNTAGAMIVLEGASQFVMDGGTINYNEGGRAGAIASRWAGKDTSIVLNAGSIIGNTASNDSWNGASIFLRSPATIGEGMTIDGTIAVNAAPGALEITGGTFTGSLTVTDGLVAEISGGTFDYDPTEWVAEGYEATDNGDGTYGVVLAKLAKVEVEMTPGNWDTNYVTIENWADLVEALGANTNVPVKVTLLEDIELTDEGLTIAGTAKKVIDLNGHTITGMLVNYAELIVNDETQNGKIDGGDLVAIDNYGALTVNGGFFTGAQSAIYNNELDSGKATVVIYGGEFTAPGDWCATIENRYGVLTVNGGKIVATNGGGYAIVDTYGETTINGGEIVSAGGTAVETYAGKIIITDGSFVGKVIVENQAGNVTVYGGTLVSNTPEYYYGMTNANGGVTVLYGGTYERDYATAEGTSVKIAEGYISVDNDDGTFTVQKVVAKIGDVYFGSLQDAIDKADPGDEIIVLENINIADQAIQTLGGKYNTLFLVEGKAVTVNLNGKTISGTYTGDSMLVGVFSTDNGGKLTLTGNGTIDVTAASTVYGLIVCYSADSSIVIENGTYKLDKASDSLIYTDGDENVTVKGGSFTLGNIGTGSNGSPWIFNAGGQNTKNIIVQGGTFNADIIHQYYPFEVMAPKELALVKGVGGIWYFVPSIAYINEQEWSSAWYTNEVGYATFDEAIAAVEGIRTKNGQTSAEEFITLLGDVMVTGNVDATGIKIEDNGFAIRLALADATLTAVEGLNVITDLEGYEVVYEDGTYKVSKIVIAEIFFNAFGGSETSITYPGFANSLQELVDYYMLCNNANETAIPGFSAGDYTPVLVIYGGLSAEDVAYLGSASTDGTYVSAKPMTWTVRFADGVDARNNIKAADGYVVLKNDDGTLTVTKILASITFEFLDTTEHYTYPGYADGDEPIRSMHDLIDVYLTHIMDRFGMYPEDPTITLHSDIALDKTFLIDAQMPLGGEYDYDLTLDLNGYTITSSVTPAIRIVDDLDVTVKNGTMDTDSYCFILGASDGSSAGNLTIESGSYTGTTSVVSVTKGTLTVLDGEFKTAESEYGATYLLNCIDANYKDNSAVIIVKGGTFYGFNPENNAAEGAGTNFVADGYAVNDNGDDTYTVVTYVEWIKAQLLAGNDVVLDRDVVVTSDYTTSEDCLANGFGEFKNWGIFTVISGDVTFDLNGHNVTYTGHSENFCNKVVEALFYANNGAKLTIVDSSADKTGSVDVYGMATAVYSTGVGSVATVKGGTWNGYECPECGAFNIFLYASHGGELYIEDGYFSQNGLEDSDLGSILIVEQSGAVKNLDALVDFSQTKVEITGGTFVGMNPEQAVEGYQKTWSSIVWGNTNVVASGYKAIDNGDGSYTVKKCVVTIGSVEDLLAFGNAVTNNTLYQGVKVAANPDVIVLLTADLNLTDSGFAPMGNGAANAFSGTFDGQGHIISNMTLICDYYRGVGFFRSLGKGATIKNLTFENADVNNGAANGANHFYGVVAGFSNNVTLDNVDIRDSKVTCKYAGSAMIGCLEGASTIKNCDIENVILNTTSIRGAVYGILGNSVNGHTASLENNTNNVVFIVDGEIKAVKETLKYNEWADGTEYTESMYVAQIGDTKYASLADAIAAANDGDTVTLIDDVVRASSLIVDKDVTIDFNGYTVYGSEYIKTAPVLRILAEVTVKNGAVDGRDGSSCYAFIVGNSDTAGSLTIVDGKYYGDVSAVSVTKGTLTIEGGYFEATEYNGAHEFTLNCIDANYKDGTASIVVKGGTFYKFNPENNASEGVGTNYVPAEYMAIADGDNYVVTEWNYEIWTKADLERLSAIVNGGNTLEGVTVKLMANIDLYELDENGERVTFTPIGNHSDGGVFKGTFDGQDHTISNLYQNGWALGYEWGVYGSAGLFGKIEDATVKNLTLTGAEILVEGGDVGGITGSATGTCVFENITITDSAFATFNNGCASIIAWSGAGNYTFKNITIASDVAVAGLWGSFDSSLGGVVGQAEPGATYNFEDVYVACRIDAYNDCTASYDYYNYRMSGMIMGRLEKTTTIDGRNYPDTSKYNITCTNVTVEYGYWMDYHYCDPTPSNMNGGRGMRVEAGYAYDGLPADYDHSQCTTHHMALIPFDQLFGGDQFGVKGLPTFEGVTVIYPFYAAQIDGVKYKTLADAFAAAVDGDVITLLKDVTLSETVLTKTEGAITLDLGGFTITTENEINPAIRVLTDLTVKNGTMDTEAYCFIVGGTVDDEVVAGSLTIVDGTYTGTTSVISVTKGTLTVLGGEFKTAESSYGATYLLNCIDANYKDGSASIIVKGGRFYGFNPENNAAEGTGTNFVPMGYRASIYGTIDGVDVYDVVELKATVEAGDITYYFPGVKNVDNVQELANYYFLMQSAMGWILGYDYEPVLTLYAELTDEVVLGNTPSDDTDFTLPETVTWTIVTNGFNADQIKAADGYAKVDNGDGTITIQKAVAKIGNTYFATLQDAIDKAEPGDEIIVLENINIADQAIQTLGGKYNTLFLVEGKAVTVNLNGKTISGTYTGDSMLVGVFSTDNGGKLTLTGNGTIDVTAASTVYGLIVCYSADSSIVIENGTYKLDKASDSLIYTDGDENVTVKGGSFTLGNIGTGSNGSPWIFNAGGQNTKNIIVQGGTFNADIIHQYYPFEVMAPKELALVKGVGGIWYFVPSIAYINEQEWSSAWYTNEVGYATFDEAIAAVEGIRTKNGQTSAEEFITLLGDVMVTGNVDATGIKIEDNGFAIRLALADATLTAVEGLNVITDLEGYEVVYEDGVYKVTLKGAVVLKTKGSEELKYFDTIAAAMTEASNTAGTDVIYLIADHTENIVLVYDGTTLDVRDKTLTADYLVVFKGGFLTGKSYSATRASGTIKIDKDRVIIAEGCYADSTSALLPVWNKAASSYVFGRFAIKNNPDEDNTLGAKVEDGKLTVDFKIQTNNSTASFMTGDTYENHGVSVRVVAEWTISGVKVSKTYVYTDAMVQQCFSDTNSFKFDLANADAIENLTVKLQVVSDTGSVVEVVQTLPEGLNQ